MERTSGPGWERGSAIAALPKTAASAAFYADTLLVHPPKSRRTALLLCLFLGWMGSHRFYVGKKGTGRLYLLTGGIFLLGVIVDLVMILTGSFEDRNGEPLV
jgi:hypothetical protein